MHSGTRARSRAPSDIYVCKYVSLMCANKISINIKLETLKTCFFCFLRKLYGLRSNTKIWEKLFWFRILVIHSDLHPVTLNHILCMQLWLEACTEFVKISLLMEAASPSISSCTPLIVMFVNGFWPYTIIHTVELPMS